MTLITKTIPGKDPILGKIRESNFDTEFGGPVARMMRDKGHIVLTSGWVTINVPTGGSLMLEWVDGQ